VIHLHRWGRWALFNSILSHHHGILHTQHRRKWEPFSGEQAKNFHPKYGNMPWFIPISHMVNRPPIEFSWILPSSVMQGHPPLLSVIWSWIPCHLCTSFCSGHPAMSWLRPNREESRSAANVFGSLIWGIAWCRFGWHKMRQTHLICQVLIQTLHSPTVCSIYFKFSISVWLARARYWKKIENTIENQHFHQPYPSKMQWIFITPADCPVGPMGPMGPMPPSAGCLQGS
jgi:hypothetical protein